MPVTTGQYEYKLDPKNRLVVPPRYREALIADTQGSDFTLTLGADGSIGLFLPSQWERYLKKVENLSLGDQSKLRDLRRAIFRKAEHAPLDDQGRILIPQHLKKHARLKKDVIITGAGDRAEIWDRANFKAYAKKAEPLYDELVKDLDL